MVSGRSKIAAEFSLNKKFNLLNGDKSIFLEDEKRKYAKPHPYGVIKVVDGMDITNDILYCGDSFEDLIMAKKAEKEINLKRKNNRKVNIVFCGVYGLSANHQELIKKFKENSASFIIKYINNLPNILNKV
jgi:phosphoglycolate phosphatase-like HAD superfamily hydrolase